MKKYDFNRGWTVRKAEAGFFPQDLAGEPVILPHDAMIWEKRSPDSPTESAGGWYPGGDYEYRKIWYVGEAEADQTFILDFEGIFNRGYVYVNGALAGNSSFGYEELFVDITPYLYFGAENVITVLAVNSDIPNSRWYTGSGIYRPVTLYTGGEIRIGVNDPKISTPEISEKMAVVKVETAVRYDGKTRKSITLKTEITDGQGQPVAEETSRLSLLAEDETVQTQRIYVRQPQLWSVDHPALYHCSVTLYDGETVLDTAESTFGIRSLALNPEDGLLINGEKILLRGGCIHHDNGPVGAATFARAEERRIELLKEAGFNSVRLSHNSSSKALLDACDRIGMLVMEESFDTWTQHKKPFDASLVFADIWEKYFEGIVEKDFNHPSVFMYSIGNEIQDVGTEDGARWSRRLTEKVRALDPTRYVTNAVNGLVAVMDHLPQVLDDLGIVLETEGNTMSDDVMNDTMTALLEHINRVSVHPDLEKNLKESYETLDLIGLNYMRDAYDQMKEYPNRVFYGSETFPPDIDLNWKKVKELPACLGDYTWTAWDYIGEAGVGIVTYDMPVTFAKPYPAYLAYCGDFDITGYRRPLSYFREIVFGQRKDPYLAVRLPEHYGQKAAHTPWAAPECVASWTWNGYEGRHCLVEVYADAPQVELFVNGTSYGRKPAGEENRFCAVFDVVYEPGEIKAAAYGEDGSGRIFALQTAGAEKQIRLTADRSSIAPCDLSYVTVEITDENGVLQADAACKVRLEIQGDGVIQGFGTGDPLSEENFFDPERTVFYGRALAVIRGGEKSGTVRLTAHAEGMPEAAVEIQVKE